MSTYYNNRLTVEGSPKDVVAFTLRVPGKEPDQCGTQYSPPPIHQPLAFSSLAPLPSVKTSGPSAKEWIINEWGCNSYAFDVFRNYTANGGTQALSKCVYTFKTYGGPPQIWVLMASRIFPRIRFCLEYEHTLRVWCTSPAGKMIYQDGRYLEALVEITGTDGGRKTVNRIKFAPDVDRVGISDNP